MVLKILNNGCLNPYFIGLSILISHMNSYKSPIECLNPYFIGLSILIGLNFNLEGVKNSRLNPYFIGLSILII